MLIVFIGIICLFFGLFGIIFTIKNLKDMPIGILFVSKKYFEILNKNRLNTLMILRSFLISFYIIAIGIFIIIEKTLMPFYFLCFIPLINLLFNPFLKKHIKKI